jgi:hypothetical protein
MTQNKKQLSPVKSVVDSAWDAFFAENAHRETEESLKEDGWLSIYDYAERIGLKRVQAGITARKKGLEVSHFSVARNGDQQKRRTMFVRLPRS